MDRPDTITEAAQIAYDLVMRRTGGDTGLADIIRHGIHDAYRTGANRALEALADEFEAIAETEWTAPGHWGPEDASELARTRKINPEENDRD